MRYELKMTPGETKAEKVSALLLNCAWQSGIRHIWPNLVPRAFPLKVGGAGPPTFKGKSLGTRLYLALKIYTYCSNFVGITCADIGYYLFVFRNERGGAYYLEKHDIAKWDHSK